MRYFILVFLAILFSHLTYAHVDLVYPEGGEKFTANDTVIIKWNEVQAHATLNWELYFSADGGETWTEISKNIGVPDREFDWIVPEIETSKGRIRVVQNNEEEDYEDVSSNFNIELAQAVDESIGSFAPFSLFPNPAGNRLSCNLYLSSKSEVQLIVLDSHGKVVGSFLDKTLHAGAHEFQWEVSQLPPGLYFCLLRLDRKISTKKLAISR